MEKKGKENQIYNFKDFKFFLMKNNKNVNFAENTINSLMLVTKLN